LSTGPVAAGLLVICTAIKLYTDINPIKETKCYGGDTLFAVMKAKISFKNLAVSCGLTSDYIHNQAADKY